MEVDMEKENKKNQNRGQVKTAEAPRKKERKKQ
jgi:hypothetical protein